MVTDTAKLIPPQGEPVLRDCFNTLRRVADYHLPAALDHRLLWLSENKDVLNSDQREELAALVELADSRSLDKIQAKAVLKQLVQVYPELASEGE